MASPRNIKSNVQPGNFQNGFLSKLSRRIQGVVANNGSIYDINLMSKLSSSIKAQGANIVYVTKPRNPSLPITTTPTVFYITCGVTEMGSNDECSPSFINKV
jgi:hypothetical protein